MSIRRKQYPYTESMELDLTISDPSPLSDTGCSGTDDYEVCSRYFISLLGVFLFVSLLVCPGGSGGSGWKRVVLVEIKMKVPWKHTSSNSLLMTKFQVSGNVCCDYSRSLRNNSFKPSGCRAVVGVHQCLKVHSCKELLWTAYSGGKVRWQ